MANEFEEEDRFREFLSDLSGKYPGTNVRHLRLLLFDHLSIDILSDEYSGLTLFNGLKKQGQISHRNVNILNEIADVTQNHGALELIKDFTIDLQCHSGEIKLSPHRKALFKALKNVAPQEVQKVSDFYDLSALKFDNIWDLVFHLEKQRRLDYTPTKWKRFGKQLNEKARNILLDEFAATCTQPDISPRESASVIPVQNQDEIIEQQIRARQKDLFKKEVMTRSSWNEYHKFNIEDIFIELKLHQSKSNGKKEELKSFTASELFNVIKSESCNILITGEGGMGKTTLLQYIAHSWATSTENASGDDCNFYSDKIFFFINMRDMKRDTDIFNEIMKQIGVEFMNLEKDSVVKFLKMYSEKIVILVDGYDELERDRRSGNHPINLFKNKLQNSTIVLTSRPISIAHLVNSSNLHIEVMGFSTESIMKYIRRYFDLIGKVTLGEALINKFRLSEKKYLWGGNYKEAFLLCSSPLLLRQICNIWTEKSKLPNNKSDLFEELTICTLNQYIQKSNIGGDTISEFSKITSHPDLFGAILLLGKLMYKGLKTHNKLDIKKSDLKDSVNNEYKYLVNIALELGFVYENISFQPGKNDRIYMPPHKLISEALAGYYLCKRIQNENNSSNELYFLYDNLESKELEELRSNSNLEMTKEFTIGFLGPDANKLLIHWLDDSAPQFYSVAKGFICVKKENKQDITNKLHQAMSPQMKGYCNDMCESLRIILKLNKKCKHMNLFDLMITFISEYKNENIIEIEERVISLLDSFDAYSEKYKLIVHILLLIQEINTQEMNPIYFRYFSHFCTFNVLSKNRKLFKHVSNMDEQCLTALSKEMDKVKFQYKSTHFKSNFVLTRAFFAHFLKHSDNVHDLLFDECSPSTSSVICKVIHSLYTTRFQLNLKTLYIYDTNLNQFDDTFLAELLSIAPALKNIHLCNCGLKSTFFKKMITECCNNHLNLEQFSLDISKNIHLDNEVLGFLLSMIPNLSTLVMRKCGLSKKRFSKMVNKLQIDYTIELKHLDISGNNLSGLDGQSVVKFLKQLPELISLKVNCCHMSICALSKIVESCERIHIEYEGNNLSGNESKSTFKFLKLLEKNPEYDGKLKLSNYSFTPTDLTNLLDSFGECNLLCSKLNLSNTNLSGITGKTLAKLLIKFDGLKHVEMNSCNLTGKIIGDLIQECKNKAVLKNVKLNLKGNNLSGIDIKTFPDFFMITYSGSKELDLRDYYFTAADLTNLVDSLGEPKLTYNKLSLSDINLSSITGKTLAKLLQIFDDLEQVDMSSCHLTAKIFSDMLQEIKKNRVMLENLNLNLKYNNLSGVDMNIFSDFLQ